MVFKKMTYGQILRYFREKAGNESKTAFARRLGMMASNHYIGAENDREEKKPSLDLLERAAKLAGLEFQDFINPPHENRSEKQFRVENRELHRQLEAVLNRDDDVSDWLASNISVFYHRFFGGAEGIEIETHQRRQARRLK
jgi:hypothetical protein